MPGQLCPDLALRPAPRDANVANNDRRHKHSRSLHSDASPLSSRNNSLVFRPAKRLMPTSLETIAVINASGRQAASLIRVATAVGYRVRAQLRNLDGVVATEVSTNPNVTVLEGELYTKEDPDEKLNVDVTRNGPISGIGVNHALICELFRGAQYAFINTTFYGDELKIGEALADAAKRAGIQHYIYSSMPDHHAYDKDWPSLPLWASKHQVEEYVRKTGLPATFVYTGIYNNNFTSLPYPLFCTEMQPDGSWVWQAPFHPDAKLPWLDAEHDVGPAILQIFKNGVGARGGRGQRVALAYEMLTPREACEAFSRGAGRPLRYVRGPIEIKVKIPEGYRAQLEALEALYALASGPNDPPDRQPPYFGDAALEASCPCVAMSLWEAPRSLEEYAREAFPVEEYANGLTWMVQDGEELDEGTEGADPGALDASVLTATNERNDQDDDEDDEDDDGLVMCGMRLGGMRRAEEEWLA